MRRTYRKVVIEQDKQRQQQLAIQQATELLQVKKQERLHLQHLLETSTPEEKSILTLKLNRCERTISKISGRLKNLGIEEKRGRPKKESGTTYKEQRKKFTAHLQLSTLDYLKQLKDNSIINNISAFLDELVAEHQKKNSE